MGCDIHIVIERLDDAGQWVQLGQPWYDGGYEYDPDPEERHSLEAGHRVSVTIEAPGDATDQRTRRLLAELYRRHAEVLATGTYPTEEP